MFDLEQYIDMFLDESKEHLDNLNQRLLDLENDASNMEIVNEIFRIAHTLKGMSSTMGFTKMANLTHKMENVLDDIRGNKLSINTNIIDILFEGLDILEGFVKSIENEGSESDKSIESILNRLENIENEEDEEDEEADGEWNYINDVIGKAKAGGLNVYDVKVTLDESCMLKSARAFLVFKSVEEDGEIIYSNPSVEDIEDEKFSNSFDITVITKLNENILADKIKNISEVSLVEIEEVTDVKISDLDEDNEQIVNDDINDKNETNGKNINNDKQIQNKSKTEKSGKSGKSAKAGKSGKTGKTVRVDIDRLDNLMNLVSELIIVKTRLEDTDISSKTQNMNEAIEYLETITTSLHDAVTKVRMVPIERVFNRFPRMIRDLSKELNKEINLIMEGEETEVDRTVIDEIGDPLIHLLRNCIDHGIETPEIRKSLNKSEFGTVKLSSYPDGNNVVIEICDDGAGINVEKVKNKAIEKGVVTKEQSLLMDDKDAANLIFSPGFSTADKISDISGRGVGLDVVKTKIEALGGIVELETQINMGTRFIIRLPLTLAIIQALLVMVGEEKYAIPLNNIKEITNIDRNDIRKVEGKDIVLYREKTLPLVDLANVIELEKEDIEHSEESTVVVVKKGDKDLGVIVDQLIGQQEIVIKSLGKYLSGINFIAGATILGNGSVALIIDTNSLF
ncbi:MAG: chemotaxis protein CheA [Tepidibacter sp.]|jgi:two-component system chemotaxis sensor kinase CheA|uniref:chemotaxis protein CheA n=1 Tax=Tepidibacter sp. TaxID=2529387 RepID=UPI0025E6E975|nr:chemotaxis protein CheA [Tepidibacter sp.]MCT4507977.1 chemotaxis protein CheA [Tepidibacter sp.]